MTGGRYQVLIESNSGTRVPFRSDDFCEALGYLARVLRSIDGKAVRDGRNVRRIEYATPGDRYEEHFRVRKVRIFE